MNNLTNPIQASKIVFTATRPARASDLETYLPCIFV